MQFNQLVQQILEENSQKSKQLHESPQPQELLTPDAINALNEFIQTVFQEQSLMLLGLAVGRSIHKFVGMMIALYIKLKPPSPMIQQLLRSRRGEQLKKIVAMYERDPEVIEIIKVLNTAKTDKSREGVKARKIATKKLMKIIKNSHVYAPIEQEGRNQGFRALKKLGAKKD